MNYKITHHTHYDYAEPVAVCHNQVLLTPRECLRLRCRSHRLLIKPTPTTSSRHKDYFGNQVHAFSIEESHRQLAITSTCRVTIDPCELPSAEATPVWEHVVADVAGRLDPNWFEAWPLTCNSPRISRAEDYAEYARQSFLPGRPILAAVLDLTERIHKEFKYDTRATDVFTSTEKAFRLRTGVCQDFAHIEIALLRSIGIPARYVSGYLRTIPPPGRPRLIGADQTHAWLSVYCGSAGWIDVDPTNNAACSTDHIPVAYGRDYSDVAPIKGVFLGGGAHDLKVSVDVCPSDT